MAKQAIEGAKRTNLFLVDPMQLCVVWDDSDPRFASAQDRLVSPDIDSLEGEKHPLFDDRVFMPLQEGHINLAMKHGIPQNVIVRKNGESLEVVDGRRRTLIAREANLRLVASGEEPIRLSVTIKRGDEISSMAVMVMANELRTPDEIYNKAKKANRLIEKGADVEEVAEYFSVTTTTIKNWLKLLEMSDRVQKGCRTGLVNVSEAIQWVKEDHAKQDELLKAHVAATGNRGDDPYKDKKSRKTGKKTGTTRAKAPSKASIRQLIEALPKSKAKDILMWAVGDLSMKKAKETIKELADLK